MRKTSFLTAVLVLGLAPLAWAQTSQPAIGTITARSYSPLPAGAAIVVQPADDTDQSQRLKGDIEAALRAHGYRVVNDGPLVLEFYSSEVQGAEAIEKPGSRRLNQGSLPPIDKPIPRADQSSGTGLLSGLNQGLFGTTEEESASRTGKPAEPRQVHLSIMLNDNQAAQRVWQGSASGELRQPDSFAATQSLVPFLLSKLGTTVGMERFDMP
ncbi:MAG TPA: hypothetical protein VKY65_17765 [Alphaproteobacteria bacterium]|nr:hypothetical protein [Alphaproteobacteria bacterium]